MACPYRAWLWSTWVKAPPLKGANILIASACLPIVNPGLFEKLSEGCAVLLACPERESPTYYGKIASMVRSSKPKSLAVVTIDGSPHCFALHASVNEAEYILGECIPREHYVVVNGNELVRISPDSIRLARYLSVIQKIIDETPGVLNNLKNLSLEYMMSHKLCANNPSTQP